MAEGWRNRQPLSGTDLADFLALRRVCGHSDSGVRKMEDAYLVNGRPVLPFISDGLAALVEVGHVTFGKPDPVSGGLRPVVVTATGRARYEQLCESQGIAPYPRVVVEERAE